MVLLSSTAANGPRTAAGDSPTADDFFDVGSALPDHFVGVNDLPDAPFQGLDNSATSLLASEPPQRPMARRGAAGAAGALARLHAGRTSGAA